MKVGTILAQAGHLLDHHLFQPGVRRGILRQGRLVKNDDIGFRQRPHGKFTV